MRKLVATTMTGALPSLNLKQKVLLWLSQVESDRRENAPFHTTQAGIATATGLSRAHVSRTIAPLIHDGWVMPVSARVSGFGRRLLSYQLTPAGRQAVAQLEGSIKKAPVAVRYAGTNPSVQPLQEACLRAQPPRTLWEAVRELEQRGFVDLEVVSAPLSMRPSFLRELDDAPSPGYFVGRHAELEGFQRWLDGRKPYYLVEGHAGIGKSTFVAYALRTLQPRRHLLWIRISAGSTASQLAQRLNAFLGQLGRPEALLTPEPSEEFSNLVRSRLRGLPIVLVIDDAHKATDAVRRLLDALAQVAAAERPFKLVFVAREPVLAGAFLRHADWVHLDPLARPEAEQLLTHLGVATGQRPSVLRAAQGNPLFLELLVREAQPAGDSLPFAHYLSRTLSEALSPPARSVLQYACALRVPVATDFFERLGIGSPAILDQLVRGSLLLRQSDGQFEMHDLVRDAFYADLNFAERRRTHNELAEAYRPRDSGTSGLEEFLHHLVRAGRRDEAAKWLLRNRRRLLERAHEVFRNPARAVPA